MQNRSYKRDSASSRPMSADKVVFKNVKKRYKLPSTITVEFILSHKAKTSSHDYVGIYARGWTQLRDFVAFERTVTAPYEEPNLFRNLSLTVTQTKHCTIDLHTDYQFVFVHQHSQVLGMSKFFQFVDKHDEDEDVSFEWKEDINEGCDGNYALSPKVSQNLESLNMESADLYLTPYEIAYNECVFKNQSTTSDRVASTFYQTYDVSCGGEDDKVVKFVPTNESACGGFNETSNKSLIPQQNAGACYIPQVNSFGTSFHQEQSSSHLYSGSKKGRALVKTHDCGYGQRHNGPSETTCFQQGPLYHVRDGSVNTGPDLKYSQNWLQQRQSSNLQLSDRSNVKCGAIPKQCPKCHAPSDFSYKQDLLRHELSQAYEQIRDLKMCLDKMNNDLQLSHAAQSKLKVLNDIANKERNHAILAQNLCVLLAHSKEIRNGDNNALSLPNELRSASWFVNSGQTRALQHGRPNVRVLSGQDKLLKAIIGRQEEKIRDLHAKLTSALKTMEKTNYPSGHEKAQLERHINGSNSIIPQRKENDNFNDSSGLPKEVDGESTECVSDETKFSSVSVQSDCGKDEIHFKDSEEDGMIVVPQYYHIDPIQPWNCEVVTSNNPPITNSDTDNFMEANNNNYDMKNMNADKGDDPSKCSLCDPASTDTSSVTAAAPEDSL